MISNMKFNRMLCEQFWRIDVSPFKKKGVALACPGVSKLVSKWNDLS